MVTSKLISSNDYSYITYSVKMMISYLILVCCDEESRLADPVLQVEHFENTGR